MTGAEFHAQLGVAVARAREAAGFTQEELAGAVGFSRSSVSNLEAGRQTISAWRLHQLAGVLRVPAVALLPAVAVPVFAGWPAAGPPTTALPALRSAGAEGP